jgi:hypothetical protein
VRSNERITGLHRVTIVRLLVIAGEHCERLLEVHIRQITVKDVQCDEMWGFVGCKEKRISVAIHDAAMLAALLPSSAAQS